MDTNATPGRDFLIGAAVHSDDRVVVAGTVADGANGRIWIRQYQANGAIDWTQSPAGIGGATAVSVNQHHDIAVAGFITNAAGDRDTWTTRYTVQGAPVWTQTFDGGGTRDEGYGVVIAKDGAIYSAGLVGISGAQTWLTKYTTN
jgi:hypothetical protein